MAHASVRACKHVRSPLLLGMQVRALSGSAAFKSDEARFVEVADASLALAQTYLQLFRGGTAAASVLSSTQTTASSSDNSANGCSSNTGNDNVMVQGQAAPTPVPLASSTGPATATAAAAAATSTPLPLQPGSIRELAAARMHLRGLLKQSQQAFEGHAKWQALSAACNEIMAAEAEAKNSAAGPGQ